MYHNQEREESRPGEPAAGLEPPTSEHPPFRLYQDAHETNGDTLPVAVDMVPATVLMRLLTTSSWLVSVRTQEDLFNNLLIRITDALPEWHGGMVWMYERNANRLRLVSIYGVPIQAETLAALATCYPGPGEALAGEAFLGSEPLVHGTRNGYPYQNTSLRHHEIFEQVAHQLPQMLTDICIPLRVGHETIGVVELLKLTQHEHDADIVRADEQSYLARSALLQALQTFGDMVAATIRNLQLYEQAERHCRRLDAFDAVVTAISTATDLRDLMRSVLDVMLGILPVSAGAILLLIPAQARLTLGACHNIPPEYLEHLRNLPVSSSPCEEVVRYGQPTLRPLIEERGETALLAVGMESCAYVPLLAGGTVVGVLALYGDALMPRQLEIARLMPLGNQVGFAIANVRLYEDSQLERRKLNTVMNSITEGVVLYDSQGQILLANEAAMQVLSLDTVPFQQPFSEMPDFYGMRTLEGDALTVEMLPMAQALAGEVFHDYRLLLRGTDGTDTVMSFSGAPAHSDDNTIEGAVIVFRDITAAQRLERAKDEFLAIAAHELRNPLAAVRSYADMLLRRERQRREADTQDMRGLTILSQQVTHMLRMVDNLLDVSRLDAGQFDLQRQRVNLIVLAHEVMDQLRPSTKKQELMLESDQPELWIACDMLRIRQVLTNLMSNAIKYGPPEKPITVSMHIVEQRTRDGEPPASDAAAQAVLISVRDMGSGIPPEQQERIFERYYRVKSRRRSDGLGLGLYLSREFVLRHGGTIWVESNASAGSTFSFTLPIQESSNELQGIAIER